MQALQNQPITIYGDGSQTRSFCYVDDMIDAFVALMASGDDVTGPINVGNPGEFTMLELAQNIIDLTGSKSKIERRPLPQDDPKQRRPNIEKAQQHLGWSPKVPLREGLAKTIEYFDKLIASKKARLTVRSIRNRGNGREAGLAHEFTTRRRSVCANTDAGYSRQMVSLRARALGAAFRAP